MRNATNADSTDASDRRSGIVATLHINKALNPVSLTSTKVGLLGNLERPKKSIYYHPSNRI